MRISVVIPTCNRKRQLLTVLTCIDRQTYPVTEVIIVDSGEDRLTEDDLVPFQNRLIRCLSSQRSVCVQRNVGVSLAGGELIFLCDDDLEFPPDYLSKLVVHLQRFPEAGAVSGLVLQQYNGEWTAQYPETSAARLLWKFVFQLGIWGEIRCPGRFNLIQPIKDYYRKKGNHLSKAGWPVITDLSGEYFTTPLYGLGAALVKASWLLNAPFDEVLDSHGIGDNYGVALDFPARIHVVRSTSVYHHMEQGNRLRPELSYYRRLLALHYFIVSKGKSRPMQLWFLWSIAGNALYFLIRVRLRFFWVTAVALIGLSIAGNPYVRARKNGLRIVNTFVPYVR